MVVSITCFTTYQCNHHSCSFSFLCHDFTIMCYKTITWLWVGSNHRPRPYERRALTGWATKPPFRGSCSNRWGRDSNPRDDFSSDSLAVSWFRPLIHLTPKTVSPCIAKRDCIASQKHYILTQSPTTLNHKATLCQTKWVDQQNDWMWPR